MGTEVAISFSALRTQLEDEKSSLFKIDENIKKIVQTTGRFNDRFNPSGDYPRGGNRPGGRNSFQEGNNYKNDEQFGKRKHETKTVFSRLSARVQDSDGEDDGPAKRARVPSAVCRELPTRAAVLRAQGDDEQARTRNRRIFGSLLGTLQKFKQEEIGLQNKEEKKAQVERKIEEQARLEKEREQKERKTLFAEREHKKAMIKALEAKMARVQEFEKWEASQKHLADFILTKAKPHVYWLPKKMSEKANEKLMSSRKFHEKCMTQKREELQEELQRIEQRCLRPRGPWTKENQPHADRALHHAPHAPHAPHAQHAPAARAEGREGRKRDKFATDADAKDDSDGDGDDRHDDEPVKIEEGDHTMEKEEEKVADDSNEIVDTSTEIAAMDTEPNDPEPAADTDTPAADTGAADADTGATAADTSAGAADTSAGAADTSAGAADTSAGAADTSAGAADTSAGAADTGATPANLVENVEPGAEAAIEHS